MFGVNRGAYSGGRDTLVVGMGKRIKALREAQGLRQPELARLIGISQPSLSDIENEKTESLKATTLVGLCRELRVTFDALLSPESSDPGTLAEESELAAIYRAITPEDRGHLIAAARAFRERMHARPKMPPAPPRPALSRDNPASKDPQDDLDAESKAARAKKKHKGLNG